MFSYGAQPYEDMAAKDVSISFSRPNIHKGWLTAGVVARFFEWKYHTSGFLGQETHDTAGRVGFPGQENHFICYDKV
jgi:hypothetical protein